MCEDVSRFVQVVPDTAGLLDNCLNSNLLNSFKFSYISKIRKFYSNYVPMRWRLHLSFPDDWEYIIDLFKTNNIL